MKSLLSCISDCESVISHSSHYSFYSLLFISVFGFARNHFLCEFNSIYFSSTRSFHVNENFSSMMSLDADASEILYRRLQIESSGMLLVRRSLERQILSWFWKQSHAALCWSFLWRIHSTNYLKTLSHRVDLAKRKQAKPNLVDSALNLDYLDWMIWFKVFLWTKSYIKLF